MDSDIFPTEAECDLAQNWVAPPACKTNPYKSYSNAPSKPSATPSSSSLVARGEFPYYVNIYASNDKRQAGVLIAENLVLTKYVDWFYNHFYDIVVVSGMISSSFGFEACTRQTRHVVWWWVDSSYSFVIFQLDTPFQLDAFVQPVCLKQTRPNLKKVTAVGFNIADDLSMWLRKVALKQEDFIPCESPYFPLMSPAGAYLCTNKTVHFRTAMDVGAPVVDVQGDHPELVGILYPVGNRLAMVSGEYLAAFVGNNFPQLPIITPPPPPPTMPGLHPSQLRRIGTGVIVTLASVSFLLIILKLLAGVIAM